MKIYADTKELYKRALSDGFISSDDEYVGSTDMLGSMLDEYDVCIIESYSLKNTFNEDEKIRRGRRRNTYLRVGTSFISIRYTDADDESVSIQQIECSAENIEPKKYSRIPDSLYRLVHMKEMAQVKEIVREHANNVGWLKLFELTVRGEIAAQLSDLYVKQALVAAFTIDEDLDEVIYKWDSVLSPLDICVYGNENRHRDDLAVKLLLAIRESKGL